MNIDEAAEAVGMEKELKSTEEPIELYGMNFDAKDLHVPKEFDGIAELFPEQLERAAYDAEQSAYDVAWSKEVNGAILDALEKIQDVTCEYLGDTEAGAQDSISTDGGIESVSMKDGVIEIEVKNPHHLINAIISGVGYFHPPFPVDKEIDEKEFKGHAHHLKDYFEVWGERKPEPNSDHLNPVQDDDFYKEMIAEHLANDIGEKEAAEALEKLKEKEDIDVEEYAIKIEKMTKGAIKADDLIKIVDPQLKLGGKDEI